MRTIDFHIWLTQALAFQSITTRTGTHWLEIQRFDRYFEKTGANRTKHLHREKLRSLTRADLSESAYIIPDVNFLLSPFNEPQKRALNSLEVTRGRDTKRVLSQMDRHIEAMSLGVLPEKYGLKQGYRVLFVFERSSHFEAVKKRFLSIPNAASFQDYFLGTTLEDCEQDILGCWQIIASGERVRLVGN